MSIDLILFLRRTKDIKKEKCEDFTMSPGCITKESVGGGFPQCLFLERPILIQLPKRVTVFKKTEAPESLKSENYCFDQDFVRNFL